MSKQMIEALVIAQLTAIKSNSAKERMPYAVAKVENGEMFDLKGNSFGKYDGDDVVFIDESDLKLARIAGTRLEGYVAKAKGYFGSKVEDETIEEVTEKPEPDDLFETADGEVVKKALKALKKGKVKKALKIAETIEDKKLKKSTLKEINNA